MNRNCGEKANRLAFAYANTYVNVNVASLGSIVVVSGLRETITGDTLVSSSSYAKAHPELQQAGVEVPDPVFFCTIEPPSMSKQKQLELALNNLAREDPSLRVIISDEAANDQTVLSGMGELHLEIILQRIRKEYKVDADLGQLMVTYKEAPKSPVQGFEMEFERTIAGSNHKVSLELSLRPLEEKTPSLLKLSHRREDSESLENLRPWQLKALTKGFKNAVSNGPLLGYPVLGAAFELNKVTIGMLYQ
jgi:elongation factor G